MAAIPQPDRGTVQAIYGLHAERVAAEAPRTYLGWSQIGDECDRALWYGFRHVGGRAVEGRLARLFDTGHREEARVLEELRAIGCEVYDREESGSQFGVASLGGHLRGHVDAIVVGLPEAPATPHLVDVKTIKSKKFDELLKKGMRAMYPKYWAQAHGYMGHLDLERAMFIFVCKDDDRLHVERFAFDRAEFAKYEARAERIICAETPPQRISEDPAWFACKFCDFHDVCHGARIPTVNCRTCAHATPDLGGSNGTWVCAQRRREMGKPAQAHDCHRFIPILLAPLGEPVDSNGDSVTYESKDGRRFVNGQAPGFTSAEIAAAGCVDVLASPTVQGLKTHFNTARVVA
jgi:PD-(D/E)XK nuclease superfamily protein